MVRGLEAEDDDGGVGAGVDQCLDGVEEPAVRRVEPGLGQGAHRAYAVLVVGERHGRRGPPPRPVLQAHPCLRDHAERPLGAEEHPVRRRSCPGPGEPAGLDEAGGGDDAQRLGEVVDVGEHGGEVATGPGREPAAERGELEGLREEPQRVAAGPELLLQVRPEHAGLDERRSAGRVDLQHPVHRPEVEADGPGVPVADSGLDPADHRRAAAEGDHGDPGVAAPVEDLRDLGLAGGADDQVRDEVESSEQRPYDVAEGLARDCARVCPSESSDVSASSAAGGRTRLAGTPNDSTGGASCAPSSALGSIDETRPVSCRSSSPVTASSTLPQPHHDRVFPDMRTGCLRRADAGSGRSGAR